ncbi:hypothetical protein [Thalassospira profundimaris]|uniref:hypothetical protein n=1 Tax=Thalassospira profundimaris TaxID=502049 RepID=UPI0002872952|nr:hypothetical protein [Thalassospira profundimaris]EKF08505.1 hypothetical protein TH2_10319 [Thalassospira profundimaris WP0211]
MDWFSSLDVELKAAVIGSLTVLLGIFLKDFVFQVISDYFKEKKEAEKLFNAYAPALSDALTALFFRLNETLIKKGRGTYLVSKESRTAFEEYKYVSTIYRLGAVISWITALKKENAYKTLANKKSYERFATAISNLERAMSDGNHVEDARLQNLVNELIGKETRVEIESELAIRIDHIIARELNKKQSCRVPAKLSSDDQSTLCHGIVAELKQHDPFKSLGPLTEAQKTKIIQAISIREAWLYRDYQSAIGEAFFDQEHQHNRNYSVIGFGKFEQLFYENHTTQRKWFDRLGAIFDDVNLSNTPELDARIDMLRQTFLATIELIYALDETKGNSIRISGSTLSAARKAKSDIETAF